VTGPTPNRSLHADPQDRQIRRTWWLLVGSFVILGVIAALRLGEGAARPVDVVLAGLIVIAGCAAILHRSAVHGLEVGRRSEAESVARILQALSRSVSPDAIVGAIVENLGHETGADHIVVVRRREADSLEATLVTSRPGVPSSTTLLPASDLDDAVAGESRGLTLVAATGPREPSRQARSGDAPGLIAERIADRVRKLYGLTHTLAAPLRSEQGVIGAIVLSRRTADSWPASTQRILAGAAVEASAALARAQSHRAAEARASTDVLTGLPNRRYFDEFCGLLGRRRRADDAVGVLMIDIDRFKALNDAHGHATGDEVLRAVGGAIARAVRDDDVPARYGGEEFAVLLRNPTPSDAIEVGERVRDAVKRLDLRPFGVPSDSVSVGVAVAEAADEPIDYLLERADRALYRAKRTGRDRVVAAA
jgi:diguanylate cyclase (GGDEF)-like protein